MRICREPGTTSPTCTFVKVVLFENSIFLKVHFPPINIFFVTSLVQSDFPRMTERGGGVTTQQNQVHKPIKGARRLDQPTRWFSLEILVDLRCQSLFLPHITAEWSSHPPYTASQTLSVYPTRWALINALLMVKFQFFSLSAYTSFHLEWNLHLPPPPLIRRLKGGNHGIALAARQNVGSTCK